MIGIIIQIEWDKKSRQISFALNVACTEKQGKADTILVGICDQIGPLGRICLRWEYNIKLGLKQEGSASTGFRWNILSTSGRFFF